MDQDKITLRFFGREGGVSAGLYDSLNCGLGSDDDPDHVRQNLKRVAAVLNCDEGNLLTLRQYHSAQCLYVDQVWDKEKRPQADAMVTDKPGIALGILTADCAPVLFSGQKTEDGSPVVAAAHAGWGGAFKGVLEATIEKMLSLDTALSSIHAVIGPCILQSSYEIGPEFLERFLNQDADNERFFREAQRDAHYLFDLPGYVASRLAAKGVQHIRLSDIDTYKNEKEYFSYRRATHKNEPDYGRQISVAMIG